MTNMDRTEVGNPFLGMKHAAIKWNAWCSCTDDSETVHLIATECSHILTKHAPKDPALNS
jgi:hypothetical protein